MAKNSSVDPVRLGLFERLVSTIPGLELKGATIPYTAVNGNMFSYLIKDGGGLALRLPLPERANFLVRYETMLVEVYGVVQKEYVTVPEDLLARTDELAPYFDIAHGYATSLKPKPKKKI